MQYTQPTGPEPRQPRNYYIITLMTLISIGTILVIAGTLQGGS